MGKLKKSTKQKTTKKVEKKAVKKVAKKTEKNRTKASVKPKVTKKKQEVSVSRKVEKLEKVATPSYSKEVLEHFKNIILTQRRELIEEIESLTGRMIDSTTGEGNEDNSIYSLHMADQGTDAMEREKNYLLAQRNDDHIKRLDEALKRIESGTFGVCVVCGKLIEKERLEAVPTTQKHVECKNQLKRLNRENLNF